MLDKEELTSKFEAARKVVKIKDCMEDEIRARVQQSQSDNRQQIYMMELKGKNDEVAAET